VQTCALPIWKKIAGSTIYDFHIATGSSKKALFSGRKNHACRTAFVRKRIDYLHENRQRKPLSGGNTGGSGRNPVTIWRKIQQTSQLCDQSQRSTRGPRSHQTHRYVSSFREFRPGRKPIVRTDLEKNNSFPDE